MNEPTTETTTIDQPGESQAGTLPPASAATLAAGEQAINQHAADTGTIPVAPRRPGRPIESGKYAGRKRNKPKAGEVPLGEMANGSGALLLEETLPAGPEIGTETIEKPFDEEINKQYASLIFGLMVSLSNAVKKKRIIKRTGNEELANWVIQEKKVPEAPKAAIEKGLVEVARKHQVDMARTPEGLLIGGILLWQAEDAANTEALCAQYLKLRPQEVRA